MRPLPVIVHVRREEDASCVADALAVWGTSIERRDSRWDVNVTSRSLAIGELLTALHQCLEEHAISLVHVTIDGRTYAMEPQPALVPRAKESGDGL